MLAPVSLSDEVLLKRCGPEFGYDSIYSIRVRGCVKLDFRVPSVVNKEVEKLCVKG